MLFAPSPPPPLATARGRRGAKRFEVRQAEEGSQAEEAKSMLIECRTRGSKVVKWASGPVLHDASGGFRGRWFQRGGWYGGAGFVAVV
jgi:hypothetical protein